MPNRDVYFVANRTKDSFTTSCTFRTDKGNPELWDAVTGETRPLPEYNSSNGQTTLSLQCKSYQSFFVVFTKGSSSAAQPGKKNFPTEEKLTELNRAWTVTFDTVWGGPKQAIFDTLKDWTLRPEKGIKYYSGIASYHQTFNAPVVNDKTVKDFTLIWGK